MDNDAEFQKLKLLLIAGLVFLTSAWFSWVELKYKIWGEMATATVDSADMVERRGRRGRKWSVTEVRFHYADTSMSGPAVGRFDLDPDDRIQPGDQIQVQYMPGKLDSARTGGSVVPVIFFMGSLLALIGSIVYLVREANSPIPKMRRR